MSMDRVKALKERTISLVEQGLNQDLACIDSKELYEVVDVMKDMFEACKLYNEAEYFEKINKAMDESSSEDKTMKMMEKYLPEMSYARSYSPYYVMPEERYYTVGNGGRPKINYVGSSNGNYIGRRNYADYDSDGHHDNMYDGESWKYRRNYMENKMNGIYDGSSKTLEEYAKSLTEEIMEMVNGMPQEDKSKLKQKMVTLANKIN